MADQQQHSQKCVLLTGARAPVTLDLARQFAAQGHRVLVAETVPYHFCRFTRAVSKSFIVPRPVENPEGFISAVADIVKQERVDMIIPTLEEVFYFAGHHAAFLPNCELFCDPLEKLLPLHNKWEFHLLLERLGFANPQTWLLKSPADLSTLPNLKMVVKPVFSRFATYVQILEAGDRQLPANLSITPDKPWIAQTFIEGRRLCSYSVAKKGQMTAHAAYPVVFHVGTIGSCLAFEPLEHPAIQQWVQDFVTKTEYTGQIAFDFIEQPSGEVLPIECNPRSTSGAHLFRTRDNLPQAFFTSGNPLLKPAPSVRRQMFLAMLTFAWRSAWRQGRMREFLATLLTAKDVVFRWNDPLPFLGQPLVVGMYCYIGMLLNKGPIEASTFDIEWNGDA